jgi:glycosyltransferase involved in cell wall biosynthesis
MKAAIYTPYLDTLGGGERYVLSVAKVLADHEWKVYVQGDQELLKKAQGRFNLDLKKLNITSDIKRGDGYDLCFWLSDGSIPALRARKNILHFQRPFFKVDGKSLINRMKFFRINTVVVNSKFTKSWIDKEYPVNSTVIYPPVDIDKFKEKKKLKNIIYIGRFSQLEQAKRHDVLIEAFKKYCAIYGKTWKLILIGGSDVGRDDEYIENLRKSAYGYPVEIIENAPFKSLKQEVERASIFWSAAGFGVDAKHPQRLEHFGISIVEAMAAGCIPIVFNAGGHPEIINEGENGYLWNTKQELLSKTYKLSYDDSTMKRLAIQSKVDCQQFSYEQFEKNFLSLI